MITITLSSKEIQKISECLLTMEGFSFVVPTSAFFQKPGIVSMEPLISIWNHNENLGYVLVEQMDEKATKKYLPLFMKD